MFRRMDRNNLLINACTFVCGLVVGGTLVYLINGNDVKNTARYNLQGQRLSTLPQKGIYIQNGKKVVIKQ